LIQKKSGLIEKKTCHINYNECFLPTLQGKCQEASGALLGILQRWEARVVQAEFQDELVPVTGENARDGEYSFVDEHRSDADNLGRRVAQGQRRVRTEPAGHQTGHWWDLAPEDRFGYST